MRFSSRWFAVLALALTLASACLDGSGTGGALDGGGSSGGGDGDGDSGDGDGDGDSGDGDGDGNGDGDGGGDGDGDGDGDSSTDPCAGRPASCFPLCEGGQCDCYCDDTAVVCPNAAPTPGGSCTGSGMCAYGDSAECTDILECFAGEWTLLDTTCGEVSIYSCPATLEQAQAMECIDRSCAYDTTVCRCAQPQCSGAYMPQTQCAKPVEAVCRGLSSGGGACEREGQVCGSICCGISYTCTDGTWIAKDNPCPP